MEINSFSLTIFTCLGSIAYGYYLMEFSLFPFSFQSTPNSFFPNHWNLNIYSVSLLDCLTSMGSFIGTLLAGYLTYKIGRLKTLLLWDIIITISLVISISSDSFVIFSLSKLIKGLYIGVNYPTILLVLKEIGTDVKRRESSVLILQFSSTVGIFLSNLVYLFDSWKILIGIGCSFPIIQGGYLCYFFTKGLDTPVYNRFKYNRNKAKLEKKVGEDTLLDERFTLGDLFDRRYLEKFLFCLLTMALNQTSGINLVLKNAVYFKCDQNISLYLGIANLVGGVAILIPFSKKNMINFKWNFNIGFIILIIILFFFVFEVLIFPLSILYSLVFQTLISYYFFLIAINFLPDVGIFSCFLLHWIFAMINSNLFGEDAQVFMYLFYYIGSSLILLLVFNLFFGNFRKNIELLYESVDEDENEICVMENYNNIILKYHNTKL